MTLFNVNALCSFFNYFFSAFDLVVIACLSFLISTALPVFYIRGARALYTQKVIYYSVFFSRKNPQCNYSVIWFGNVRSPDIRYNRVVRRK